jgi:hypothetical protein
MGLLINRLQRLPALFPGQPRHNPGTANLSWSHAQSRLDFLPGIGTSSLSRSEYDAALIPVSSPGIQKSAPTPAPPAAEISAARPRGMPHYIRLREVYARVSLRPSTL